MKKTLLTLTVIFLAVVSMNAQDLTLSWDGVTLGDTITLWGDPTDTEIVAHAIVHNNTDKDLSIMVRRNRIYLVDSTVSAFCWGGACWPPDTEESPQAQLLTAGTQSGDEDFSGHYNPKNQNGTSIVEYTFYNEANEDQNVKIVVKYWASPMDVAEDVMKGGSISDIYPNPATTAVNINFDMPSTVEVAKVQIVNLLGSVVKEATIEPNSSSLSLNISELKGGVYFYAVVINGDVYRTRKLLIK